MNFDRRKREFADDVRVFDGQRLFHGLALNPFSGQRRAGNRGAAAKSLETSFLDDLRFRIDAHLQLHDVATFRSADESSPDVGVFFRKTSDVAGIVVVIYNFFAISHESFSSGSYCAGRQNRSAAETQQN